MTIDLHCHTRMSDGSTRINELIEIAKLRKIDVIAVTDHDTFAGSVRAAVVGKRAGIEVVPAVEISAFDASRGRKAHILCYFPRKTDRIEGLLKKICEDRRAAMSIAMQKVTRVYPIPMSMILARAKDSTNIFKQHIMQALMDAGFADSVFGEEFDKLFNPKYGLARTNIEYPDVPEVLEAVRSSGGVAVLAHPTQYSSIELMEELCEKRLIDGVEMEHPRNSEEDKKTILQCCEKYGMIVTGGTDFHGYYTTKINPPGAFTTDEKELEKLRAAAKANA